MIVLHPSSRCDICLDGYAGTTSEDCPHAIPCGHSFCKTCLLSVRPPICPLCRKPFLPDRLKKLHVDRPESSDSSIDEKAIDLLQRLSLASAEHTPAEDVAEVVEEVQAWLSNEAPESNRPLRTALIALGKSQSLKESNNKYKSHIKDANRRLRHAEQNSEHDRCQATAVEQSLLEKLQRTEDDYSTKLATVESELSALRHELDKFRYTTNPLPLPPEPLPLNRLPGFVRHAIKRNASGSGSSSSKSKSNGGSSRQGPESDDHIIDLQHYIDSGYIPIIVQPPPDDNVPSHRSQNPKQAPYSSTSQGVNHQSSSSRRQRSGIIPGATPTQRVIPRQPRWNDAQGDYTPSQEDYVQIEGNGRRRQDKQPAHDVDQNMTTSAQQLTGMNGNHIQNNLEDIDEMSHASRPAAAYVSAYASGYDEGYFYGRDGPSQIQGVRESTEPMSEPSMEGLGLIGVPAGAFPTPYPNGHAALAQVARPTETPAVATTPHQNGSAPAANPPNQPYYGHNIGSRVSINSNSSWGTVDTRAMNGSTGTMSVSDLRLFGFPAQAFEPGDTGSLLESPVRLAGDENFALLSAPRNGDHDAAIRTPRMRPASLYPESTGRSSVSGPIVASSVLASQSESAAQYPRYASDSEILTHSDGGHDRQNRDRVRRVDRHERRPPPRSFSSSAVPGRQSAATGSTYTHAQFTDEPLPIQESPLEHNPTSALGLTFDPPSPRDRPFPISAPTPLVSTRPFVRSWSSYNV